MRSQTITGFGTLAMLTYPLLGNFLTLSPETFGIWSGASVHEVAQVIATAFQAGPVSGALATVTKLSRVLLIIPILLSLGWQNRQSSTTQKQSRSLPVPWFVVFFMLLILVNSSGIVPETLQTSILKGNKLLLCMSPGRHGPGNRPQSFMATWDKTHLSGGIVLVLFGWGEPVYDCDLVFKFFR